VPVVDHDETTYAPCGAANVAADCKALGASSVRLVASVGGDDDGRSPSDPALGCGIDLWDRDLTGGTTRKTRVYAGRDLICRFDRDSVAPWHEAKPLSGFVAEASKGCDVLVVSDHAKGAFGAAGGLRTTNPLPASDIDVLVDPQGRRLGPLRPTLMTPNFPEAVNETGQVVHRTRVRALDELLRFLRGLPDRFEVC
jgi:bifunctional ADP-heptose synthase (sugar kinase/adenylyltransferase)